MPKIILKADWLEVKKPKLKVYIFNRPTLSRFTMMEFITTGLELMYRDSENMIHFSIFTTQIFPSSQKIMILKYNAISYS